MFTNEDKIITIAILAAVLLIAVFGYFLYALNKQYQTIVNWQLERIKAEVKILENERKRIATDLHDGVGTALTAVNLKVSNVDALNEASEKIILESCNTMQDIIKEFRTISYNLLPNTLVRKGLTIAIEEFISNIENANLKINFTHNIVKLSKEAELNTFRIIQEIVHNCIKHSRANTLNISLTQQNQSGIVMLNTKDNGVGFAYSDKLKHANGIGILSLQNRIEILNASMKVNTEIGAGTEYVIEIPQQ
jgi:signal transduction histidine kinase